MFDERPIKRSQADWDAFFFGMAQHVASLSKDPDRKVGAVLVSSDKRQMSFGYNGFAAHVPDLPRLLADREYKRRSMIHAEANCLMQAPFTGGTLYVTRFPCETCAEKIRCHLVTRVVAPRPDFSHARWGQSWQAAQELFATRGPWIDVVFLEGAS